MEAQELRIGNYVNYQIDKTIKSGWVYVLSNKVNIISYENYKGWFGNFSMTQGASTNSIKPINISGVPLTEEWLLKFGLKKWKNKKIWSKGNVMIYLNKKDGFCYGKASSRTYIKYVHQLQNLVFALIGEELLNNNV